MYIKVFHEDVGKCCTSLPGPHESVLENHWTSFDVGNQSVYSFVEVVKKGGLYITR